MALYKSKTEFQIIEKNESKVQSNCSSIMFKNQSTLSYDASGNPTGWVIVINQALKLLPGEAIEFGQNTAGDDTTEYHISFSNELGGVGNNQCLIARIITMPKC